MRRALNALQAMGPRPIESFWRLILGPGGDLACTRRIIGFDMAEVETDAPPALSRQHDQRIGVRRQPI
jgi:hypothetical protein